MKIGIDCRALYDCKGNIKGGIGYYIFYLLINILKEDKENKYILFFDRYYKNNIFNDYKNVQIKIFPFFQYKKFLPFIYSNIIVPLFLKKQKIDLMHFPANIMPIFYFGKSILTVHDVSFYVNPSWFNFRPFFLKVVFPLSVKKATKIIAVSCNTKNDLNKYLKLAEPKIKVVYEGVNVENGLEPLRIKPNLKSPTKYGNYLFFIGTIEPRKNLINILKAIEKLFKDKEICHKIENLKFVIAGTRGWKCDDIYEYANKSKFSDRFIFLGKINNKTKFKLMLDSKGLLYPSLCEGFGLPILEAFSLGVPVLTSNLGATKEIAGDCACLVDPINVKGMAGGIKKILIDKAFVDKKIINARKRVDYFSWQKTAKNTFDIYCDILK